MSPSQIDLLAHGLIFLPCLLGFLCLALAMYRHQMDLFDKELSKPRIVLLRCVGWLCLLIALLMCAQTMGWGFGLVAYSGHTSIAAGLVFISLVLFDRLKRQR
ncbi:MAG: DUF3325 domain-containing protein [Alcaligenes sp.]